jgi:polysaccharide chain length determinant protein (PEP-CTERM system associated)
MTMEDFSQIVRRRKWLLIGPAVLMSAATYMVSLEIPDRFESKTTVLVQEQRVPDSIVKSVVTEDSGARLSTMKERILSRTRLQPIVERFSLFSSSNLPIEDRIKKLQDAIEVKPTVAMEGTRASQLPGFTIGVKMHDARLAQQVCSEILNMFVEEDVQSGAQQALNIVDFVSKQLEEARQKMNAQDQKLADFKRRYLGALPDQEAANLNLLTGVNTQMEAVTQALEREEQNKALWESELLQQVAAWKASQRVTGTSPAAMDTELKKKQQELALLQDKFTDDFPNVKAKKAEIEDLKKKMADTEAANKLNPPKDDAAAAPSVIEPESIQRLRAEIKVSELTIQEKKKQQQKYHEDYNVYQGRVQISPMVEQEYAELTRDNLTAKADYDALLHKQNDSTMSVALQRQQQGEQFKPLDPPSLPNKPDFPNRPLFAAGGFVAGLALGAGLILLMEYRDKSIRTESDIELLLKLPTLAMVPVIDPSRSLASRVVFRGKGTNKTLPVSS